jgi:hypothetical protein
MLRLCILAALVALLSFGCTPKSANTVVAGKTVYSDMGLEGVEISALSDGVLVAETTSGYHGSFIIHLPPGQYYLRGTAKVPQEEKEIPVRGETFGVNVGTERLDQILIIMKSER